MNTRKHWSAEQLRTLIRDVSDFPKPGILFRDISPLMASPMAFTAVISTMAEIWRMEGISKIGAFDARGFIFGSVLATFLQVPFFMIRKAGKLPGKTLKRSYGLEYGEASIEILEDSVVSGDRVLLVDDVLATGGTAQAGAELVREAGATFVGLAVLIELEQLGGRNLLSNVCVESILTY